MRAALSVSGWGGGVRGQRVVSSVDSLMKLRGERGLLFPQQERSELGWDRSLGGMLRNGFHSPNSTHKDRLQKYGGERDDGV